MVLSSAETIYYKMQNKFDKNTVKENGEFQNSVDTVTCAQVYEKNILLQVHNTVLEHEITHYL